MDAITHTIIALASIAGAYYGGRWLLVREARRAFPHTASPELKREMALMDAIIKRMVTEDNLYTESIKGPQQLDLFQESKHETS
mgnify:CR=1 FL=1